LVALPESLAAAATTVIPAEVTRQIAWWRMSSVVVPQLPPSLPHFVTLMLTASISGLVGSAGSRWAAIQSSPQTYHDR
jgi:hypothetical protein